MARKFLEQDIPDADTANDQENSMLQDPRDILRGLLESA